MPEVCWQSEKLYFEHSSYFGDLVEAILLASQTIEMETYILDCDRIGLLVLQELKKAAARGVKVRLLVDGFGAFFEIPKIISTFENSKVQFQVFHPFFFPQATKWKWLRWDLILRALSHWNRRLHRKICLIDGRILFLGSFNITENTNRETGVRVEGQEVRQVLDAFETVWNRVNKFSWAWSKYNTNKMAGSLIRLNHSRKIRKFGRQDLCRRMDQALKRIWITNAYFVPPPSILRSIMFAKKRALDVTVLVPSRPHPRFMKLLTETYYRGLLAIGVKIFEYQNEFLHAKTLLIDNWALVGSSNMNHRSLFHDLEVDAVLTSEHSLRILEEQFQIDLHHSVLMSSGKMMKRPFLDRLVTWVVYVLRGWL